MSDPRYSSSGGGYGDRRYDSGPSSRGRDDDRDRRDDRDRERDSRGDYGRDRDRDRERRDDRRDDRRGQDDRYGGGGRGGYGGGRGGYGGGRGGFGGGGGGGSGPRPDSIVQLETNLFVFDNAGSSSEVGGEFGFKFDVRFTELPSTTNTGPVTSSSSDVPMASGDGCTTVSVLSMPDADKPLTKYQRTRLYWNHVSERLKGFGISLSILDGNMLFTTAKMVSPETGLPLEVLELAITDGGDPRLAGKTTASGTPANAPKNYSVKIRPAGEITDDEREHISNLRLDRGLLSKLRELKAAGGTAPVPGDKSKWVKIGDMFVDLGADASTVKQLQTGNGFTIQFFPSYRINVKKQIVGPEAVCIQRRYKPIMKESVGEYMKRMRRDPNEELPSVVVLTYTYGVPRSYTILEVLKDQTAATCTFEKNGVQVSIQQYMKDRYGVTLTPSDLMQPLLLVTPANVRGGGSKRKKVSARPLHLIPSFAYICDLSLFKSDPKLKRDMPRTLGMDPRDREAYHTAMAERLRVAIGALSVRKSTVPARYIGLGNVQLGGPGRGDTKEWFDADVNPFTGKFNLGPAKMSWNVRQLVVLHGGNEGAVRTFTDYFSETCKRRGVALPRYSTVRVDSRDVSRIHTELNREFPPSTPPDPNTAVLVVMLPAGNEDAWHAAMKDWEILRFGLIHTQCVQEVGMRKDGKALSGCVEKIVTQINAKLGEEVVQHPALVKDIALLGGPTFDEAVVYMICGVACIKNVAAMTFSLNMNCTMYGTVFALMRDNDKSFPMNTLLADAKSYFTRNSAEPPSLVVLYRSGLNPGQESRVLTNETPRLQDYLSSVPVAGSFNPVLHYVIVNKDPDIRAALTSDRGGDLSNPLPGTCIDDAIFGARKKFLLWSTGAPKGASSKAVQYHVHSLPPTANTPTAMKAIENITARLSLLYHNWEGAVSVPAPFKLAERAAERMSDHITRQGYSPSEIANRFQQWSAYADVAGLFQL